MYIDMNLDVTYATYDNIPYPEAAGLLVEGDKTSVPFIPFIPEINIIPKWYLDFDRNNGIYNGRVKVRLPESRHRIFTRTMSRILNSLTVLASMQQEALDRLVREDALVSFKYVYFFYYLDSNDRIRDHAPDELPSHCIYIALGDRKLCNYIKKRLRSLSKDDYGANVYVIKQKYDDYYKEWHHKETICKMLRAMTTE